MVTQERWFSVEPCQTTRNTVLLQDEHNVELLSDDMLWDAPLVS